MYTILRENQLSGINFFSLKYCLLIVEKIYCLDNNKMVHTFLFRDGVQFLNLDSKVQMGENSSVSI